MQRYKYQHGDRPLEGYTIQRAAGRGGFGEVYYALSDSGREVAIKAVQNYEQVELRGITQCMNLKSPHLVTIFDVKYNDSGNPFVIMEYVSGPSLRTLLAESPGGLGVQKSAFFLREIAKGLSYLHECGIVHRDLKPGNIFYENGYVKVGDYGLTKSISNGGQSGHTITVGTVHYMAPEIGEGKYSYSIDIYALGVLLYEMLTGEVPFEGASPAEILMKHMTASPNINNIEEPFAHIIKKAMAKNPADRYQSVQEMVEELFGSENIRNSVSHFAPEELSIIAKKVAAKAKIYNSPHKQVPKNPAAAAANGANTNNHFFQSANKIYERIDRLRKKVVDSVDAQVDNILGAQNARILGVTDPIEPKNRYILAFMFVIFVAFGTGFLQARNGGGLLGIAIGTFIAINVCAYTILLSQRHWFANLEPDSQWLERIITPFVAAIIVLFISTILRYKGYQSIFLPIFFPMVFIDWRRLSLPDRQKRLSLGSALWAGLLGMIAGRIFGIEPILIAAILAGTSLEVQAISSFSEQEQKYVDKHLKYKTEIHNRFKNHTVPGPENPQISPNVSGVSAYKRLWALLLSTGGLFWLNGLQRFYVGKIGTGILWFCTFGLIGIGQIIDVILILTGNFKDRYGLPLLIWHNKAELKNRASCVTTSPPEYKVQNEKKEPMKENHPISAPSDLHVPASTILYESFHPLAFLCSGIGSILILLAVGAGIVVAMQMPYFIAAGWPNENLASKMEQFFGYSSWPVLIMRLGTIITYALLFLAAIFMILGRRHLGARHLIRTLLGFICLILALSTLLDASSVLYYDDIVNLLNSHQYGLAIEELLQSWQNETALKACVLFLVSIVILAWPARRDRTVIAPVYHQEMSS